MIETLKEHCKQEGKTPDLQIAEFLSDLTEEGWGAIPNETV